MPPYFARSSSFLLIVPALLRPQRRGYGASRNVAAESRWRHADREEVFCRRRALWIHVRGGTAVPLEIAYRTFLHVGTVTRRIDLLLPSGGFWSANAYEARHSLWRGGVMMGSGIDVAAAPDGPDALDPAPRRLAVEIHPTWDLRHPVWESRIFDIQALARLPARFSF